MYEAQAALADAYLDQGRAMEARIISEDLVAREPWNKVNIDRFRRALVMLGESDPDAIISERLSGESPFLATEKMDLNEGVSFDPPPPPPRRGCQARCRTQEGQGEAAGVGGDGDRSDRHAQRGAGGKFGTASARAGPAAIARPGLPRHARRDRRRVVRRSGRRAVPAGPHVSRDGHAGRRDQGARSGGALATPAVRCGVDARPPVSRDARIPRTRSSGWNAPPKRRRRPRMPAARFSTISRRRSNRSASIRAPLRCSSSSNRNRAAIATSPARSSGSPRRSLEARLCSGGSFSSPSCSKQVCSWC